ncbi:MAG: hypothetical protein GY768_31800 [Planctomycetaceae bacterium]|nr:hypothetical protein [Planctomycetaceae bacterium]
MTLLADWSNEEEDVTALLDALGDKQLPVIAVFPAGEPYHPRKLTGIYTKTELIRQLKEAGPSESSEQVAARP